MTLVETIATDAGRVIVVLILHCTIGFVHFLCTISQLIWINRTSLFVSLSYNCFVLSSFWYLLVLHRRDVEMHREMQSRCDRSALSYCFVVSTIKYCSPKICVTKLFILHTLAPSWNGSCCSSKFKRRQHRLWNMIDFLPRSIIDSTQLDAGWLVCTLQRLRLFGWVLCKFHQWLAAPAENYNEIWLHPFPDGSHISLLPFNSLQ